MPVDLLVLPVDTSLSPRPLLAPVREAVARSVRSDLQVLLVLPASRNPAPVPWKALQRLLGAIYSCAVQSKGEEAVLGGWEVDVLVQGLGRPDAEARRWEGCRWNTIWRVKGGPSTLSLDGCRTPSTLGLILPAIHRRDTSADRSASTGASSAATTEADHLCLATISQSSRGERIISGRRPGRFVLRSLAAEACCAADPFSLAQARSTTFIRATRSCCRRRSRSRRARSSSAYQTQLYSPRRPLPTSSSRSLHDLPEPSASAGSIGPVSRSTRSCPSRTSMARRRLRPTSKRSSSVRRRPPEEQRVSKALLLALPDVLFVAADI
jgi:hypothetical protein